jgi:CP family cyanate transporter-like MFS transporter
MLLVAVLVVSLNLRGAITAVGPVLPEITDDLSLSGTAAGLLTALPVLCFALLAPASAWFGKRVGVDRAILLSVLVIAAGTVLRVFDGAPLLFGATFLIGAAMTVGNVLVPVVVKRDFAHRAGSVTGLYTAALIVGAASAAGLTAPVSAVTSWRFGLAIWAVLALAAAIVWHSATRRQGMQSASDAVGEPADARAVRKAVWRSPVAWSVALVLGAQAAAYYAVTAWLPTLLVDEVGASLQTAGFGMSLFQFVGLAGTFAVAALATVRTQQVWLAVLVAALWLVMLVGLLLVPQWWPVWSVAGGLGQGAGITLALTLVALRSRDADIAHDLSAMAQLVGYTAAAAAPLVVGALRDATGAWDAPLVVLVVITGSIAIAGMVAGRNTTVGVPVPNQSGFGRTS